MYFVVEWYSIFWLWAHFHLFLAKDWHLVRNVGLDFGLKKSYLPPKQPEWHFSFVDCLWRELKWHPLMIFPEKKIWKCCLGILLPKLFWPTVRKNCSSDREIQGRRPRICKNFEINWTIYSNSERTEQFLVKECFFNLFLEVSHI